MQDLRRRFPEFDRLVSERLALYQAKTEARIPLDFTTELLPAETQVHDKVQLDREHPPAGAENKEAPFADEQGLSANAESESAKSTTSCRSTRWIVAQPVSE